MSLDRFYQTCGVPKPEPRKRTKGRKDRAEVKVKTRVRAECVERDGYCRVFRAVCNTGIMDVWTVAAMVGGCAGPSQWTHMHDRRRSQTRNQAPEIRHDTAHSFMACERHHDQYDGRQKPRLFVTALTSKGANGPLKMRLGKS